MQGTGISIFNSTGTDNVPIGGDINTSYNYASLAIFGTKNMDSIRYACLYIKNTSLKSKMLLSISCTGIDPIELGFNSSMVINGSAELISDNNIAPVDITFGEISHVFDSGLILTPNDTTYFWVAIPPSSSSYKATHSANFTVEWIDNE